MHLAVKRILQRQDALSKYSTENDANETVFMNETMANPETRVILCFLNVYLEKINNLNRKFQKKLSEIGTLDFSIKEFFNSILNALLKLQQRSMDFGKKNEPCNKNERLGFDDKTQRAKRNSENETSELNKEGSIFIKLS